MPGARTVGGTCVTSVMRPPHRAQFESDTVFIPTPRSLREARLRRYRLPISLSFGQRPRIFEFFRDRAQERTGEWLMISCQVAVLSRSWRPAPTELGRA